MDTHVVTTQAELQALWLTLMSPLGFSGPSLWFLFIDERGVVFPHITQVEDAVEPATGHRVRELGEFFVELAAAAGRSTRVAFLRSRSGSSTVTDIDRAWASSLYAACQQVGLACEVVHLATDDAVVPLPLDALPVSA